MDEFAGVRLDVLSVVLFGGTYLSVVTSVWRDVFVSHNKCMAGRTVRRLVWRDVLVGHNKCMAGRACQS